MTYTNEMLKPQQGQAAMLAVVAVVISVAVLASGSIGSMLGTTNQQNMVEQRSLQTYYVAQTGIQEALATRMVPRSNFLNFVSDSSTSPFHLTLPSKVTPYNNTSGLVYQRIAVNGNKADLIGVYRYLVVGGDPSRNADTTYGRYYGRDDLADDQNHTPRLVTFYSSPDSSPFYVISNGMNCVKTASITTVGINQFQTLPGVSGDDVASADQLLLDAATGKPQCEQGYRLQETTLVAEVLMEQENPTPDDPTKPKPDRIKSMNIVAGSLDGKPTPIKLPNAAFIPGSGWHDTISDFNKTWAWPWLSTVEPNRYPLVSPARPLHITFYKFGPNTIYKDYELPTNTNTFSQPSGDDPIPSDASIMLYFNGPIDYRSLSNAVRSPASRFLYDRNLTNCKSNNNIDCAIRLYKGTSSTPYGGMITNPILPYLTKVLLLPPLGNNFGDAQNYAIKINLNKIRSFSYAPGSNTSDSTTSDDVYTINFKTQEAPP